MFGRFFSGLFIWVLRALTLDGIVEWHRLLCTQAEDADKFIGSLAFRKDKKVNCARVRLEPSGTNFQAGSGVGGPLRWKRSAGVPAPYSPDLNPGEYLRWEGHKL